MGDDGVANWKQHTTPFERVLHVTTTVSQPHPVHHIARDAAVDTQTTQQHLDHIANIHVLRKTGADEKPAYGPIPSYTRAVSIQDLLAENDVDGLVDMRTQMTDQLTNWRTQYRVHTPDELRARAKNRGKPE